MRSLSSGGCLFPRYIYIVAAGLLLSACVRGPAPGVTNEFIDADVPEMSDYPNAVLDKGVIPLSSQALTISGDPEAHEKGVWSEAASWPLMAIHAALLPDGKVLTYGTNSEGGQAAYIYDVWDPALGLGAVAHTTLDVTTGTDIFCSAQLTVPGTNQMIIAGGDLRVSGVRNYSNADVNFLNTDSYGISKSPVQLLNGRWYPTLTNLPNGELLLHGGRSSKDPIEPTTLPEVYSPTKGWRSLPGADSLEAYKSYYYPWSFVTPSGKVFFTNNNPQMWLLDTSGEGNLRSLGKRPDTRWRAAGSAVMYSEGRVMIAGGASRVDGVYRSLESTLLVDLNQDTPQVTNGPSMTYPRSEHNLTVLPNGEVLATGGSAVRNELEGVAYAAEIWNPETSNWRTLSSAAKPRLYHSSAVLLPDGTVLTAGGGSPGPTKNVNAEVFFPPYLFEPNGSGRLAGRPLISAHTQPRYSRDFSLTLGSAKPISKVSLVSLGSATHAWDMGQRFVELNFTQNGNALTITAPRRPELAPPGNYMLFVLDENGVPSEAAMTSLPAAGEKAEFGTVTAGQGNASAWTSVKFERGFSEPPIVAMSPASFNGSDPVAVRVRDVTAAGFEYQLDEWENYNGSHIAETLFYLALPEGEHDLGGLRAYAGRGEVNHTWTTLALPDFAETPAVFTQVTSHNGGEAVTTRIRDLRSPSFRAHLREREAADNRHAVETLHYIALEYGLGTVSGQPLAVGSFRTDDDWRRADFGTNFSVPYVLAAIQSYSGGDTATLRYRDLGETSVQIKVEEETSRDEEVSHAFEDIAWLVVEGN